MVATIMGSGACGCFGQELDLPEEPLSLSPWFHEVTLRSAAGYKDNVALSAVSPTASPFISTGFEGILSRLSTGGPSLDLFAIFDDIRYLSAESVEKEQIGLFSAKVKQDLEGGWQGSFAFDYVYSDQVLDVSITEADLNTLQVQSHGFSMRPGLRFDVSSRLWTEAEFGIERQIFAETLDNTWEIGPKLIVGVGYGHKSEVTLSYQSESRNYDTDPRLDDVGTAIAGPRRAFSQQEVRLTWRHYFDEARRWRSVVKGGYKWNEDNAAGYFNYTKAFGGLQLLYQAKSWQVRGEARFAAYSYSVQTVGTDKRYRHEAILNFRAEKQLKKFVKAFAEYEHELTDSNDVFEQYTVNIFTAGLNWIF